MKELTENVLYGAVRGFRDFRSDGSALPPEKN